MEDVDLLIEGEAVGRLGAPHQPIVERDGPPRQGWGSRPAGPAAPHPADIGLARVYGAGKAIC